MNVAAHELTLRTRCLVTSAKAAGWPEVKEFAHRLPRQAKRIAHARDGIPIAQELMRKLGQLAAELEIAALA